jgi:hypothetical protein
MIVFVRNTVMYTEKFEGETYVESAGKSNVALYLFLDFN